jgi:AraC family transcriptional regulator
MGDRGTQHDSETLRRSTAAVMVYREKVWPGLRVELVRRAFDEGAEYQVRLSEHLLWSHLDGPWHRGDARVEGGPRQAGARGPGQVYFVPAGRTLWGAHEREPGARSRGAPVHVGYISLFLDPAAVGRELGEASCLEFLPSLAAPDPMVRATLVALQRLVESDEDQALSDLFAGSVASMLVAHLALRYANRPAGMMRPPSRNDIPAARLRHVVERIEDDPGQPYSLSEFGELAGLSPWQLCRAFKQVIGMPLHRYALGRRVERAKELLASSDAPVAEVACSLGWAGPRQFVKAFQAATGSTPAAYRRRLRD